MPKYYCDYCKSYLTHDSLSVRKSHLSGKNHIRFYCKFYEDQARKNGLITKDDIIYDFPFDEVYKDMPGRSSSQQERYKEQLQKPQEDYYQNQQQYGNNRDNNNNNNSRYNTHNNNYINNNGKNNNRGDRRYASQLYKNKLESNGLPPPPSLYGLPVPPPSVYHYNVTEERQKMYEAINYQNTVNSEKF
ncbi:unnamed protein product [[Candida] boidinii]|uniref:Unnamed protein product n=1 Tax=Candida boidinii TaxID=5477 RepID=A0A9W6WGN3_CANBO|nr:hypothetical protein BVG19_g3194 [[Candida] boidinii]OWB51712.1 hypothetical protein B5S27_g3278 [[Candida] boidinii]OWB66113.1 hypothetical protein B5S30_g1449 [[Candida] boidinii]OWB86507.1 hypothetical protein B5S33_g5206 [[Candida] boidinii]GME71384.1 unnamed protein product [[Candida] boidinii]